MSMRSLSLLLVTLVLTLLVSTAALASPSPEQIVTGNIGGGSINSLGEAVWSQYDPGTGSSQIFSSLRGQLTSDYAEHSSPVINNLGDLVWIAGDTTSYPATTRIRGIIAGKNVVITSTQGYIYKIDLNDRGEVVWNQIDNGVSQIYSSLRGRLTGTEASSNNPSINNQGEILFARMDPTTPGPAQIYKIPAGGGAPVAVTASASSHDMPALNDAGEMAWLEQDPATSTTRLMSSVRGELLSGTQLYLNALDLNNCGDLIYNASTEQGTGLYRLGSSAPCVSIAGDHGTRESAAPVSFGDIITGLTDGTTAPVSWYSFAASTGDSIDVRVNYDGSNGKSLTVSILDPQGNLIAGPVSGLPMTLKGAATESGSYLLKVEGGNGRIGYSISLSKYSENCGTGPCPDFVAGGDLFSGVSINSLGEMVWSQRDPVTNFHQIFSSLRGQLTFDLLDHSNPAINNMGDLLWTVYDNFNYPSGYKLQGVVAGKPVSIAQSQNWINKADINDRGEIVWSQNNDNGNVEIHSNLRGVLTSADKSCTNPSINNQGDVTYLQFDPVAGGTQQVMRLAAGTTTPVAVTSAQLPYTDAATSESQEVVWSTQDWYNGTGAITSSSRGDLLKQRNINNVDVNSCGDVAYMTYGESGSELYRLGKNAPCVSIAGTHGTRESAAPVSFGDIITGLTDSATAPVSWYSFAASTGDSIDVRVNYDGSNGKNLTVSILDPQGNLIAGPVSGLPMTLKGAAAESGSYLLKVEGGNGRIGYSISLSKYSENCGTGPCPDFVAGGDLFSGVSINSLGEMVWSQRDPVTNVHQIFSSLRGQLTFDLFDHSNPAINNMGDLLWTVYDNFNYPSGYKLQGVVAGKPVTIAQSQNWINKADINDRGEIVWSQNNDNGNAEIHSNLRGVLTSADKSCTNPSINNQGDVTYLQFDPVAGGTQQVMRLAAGTTTPVAVTSAQLPYTDAATSESQEVVWSTQDWYNGTGSITSSSRGDLLKQRNINNVDVNGCGDVAYMTYGENGSELYRLGKNAPCVSIAGDHGTRESAAPVSFGDIITGLTDGTTAPVSWYSFPASTGDSIEVRVNYDGSNGKNLTVSILDPQGNLIAGPVSGLPMTLKAAATESGSYLLKVEGGNGNVGYSIALGKSGSGDDNGGGASPVVIASGVSNGASINSLGEAVWSQADPATGRIQIFSSWRGQLTFDQVDHSTPAINDRGDLVWQGIDASSYKSSIQGVIGGKRVIVAWNAYAEKLDINNSGEVVWSQIDYGAGKYRIYSNLRGQIHTGGYDSFRPAINNAGDVAYLQNDPESGTLQVYRLLSASSTPVKFPSDLYRSDVTLNDSGELLWSQYNPVTSSKSLFSSTRGELTSVSDVGNIDMNNCGDLVYSSSSPAGSFLYRLGSSAPCASYPGSHDTQAKAAVVIAGETFIGVADASAPVSWYRFDASAGDTLKIEANYDTRFPNPPVIGLYDGQGNLITPATGRGPLEIRTTAANSGSYYLRVEGEGGRIGFAITVNRYGSNCGSGFCAEPVTAASGNLGSGAAINSLGEMVWSQLDLVTGRYQIVSSQRGVLTIDPVDHLSPAINNLGDVVWLEQGGLSDYAIAGFVGGKRTSFAVDMSPFKKVAINDRREVVYSVYVNDSYTSGGYQVVSTVRGQLTSGAGDHLNPSIDNEGGVSYLLRDRELGTVQVMKLAAGSSTPVPVTNAPASRLDAAANGAGETIWSEIDPATHFGHLLSSVRGGLLGVSAESVAINSCGDILYRADGPDGPALYRIGNAAPCVTLSGGGSLDEATAVAFGDIFSATAEATANPANWYRFQASAGDMIHVIVNFDSRQYSALSVGLYDPQGNLVAGPTGWDPPVMSVNYPAPYTGSYFLKVGVQGGRVGYTVSISKYTSNCGAALCPDQVSYGSGLGYGISLNALGEAVWTQYDPETQTLQIFSSQRGPLSTDPIDHYAPSINNVGDLVWGEQDKSQTPPSFVLKGTVGGKPFLVKTGYLGLVFKTDINDSGEVVWSQGGDIYSSVRGKVVAAEEGGGSNPSINNQGDIVFLRIGASKTPQVFKLAAGSTQAVAVTDDPLYHQDAALSDGGETVWSQFPSAGVAALQSDRRGALLLNGVVSSVDVNSCGDILYMASNGADSPALYRLGSNAPCVSYAGAHNSKEDAATVNAGGTFTGVADSSSGPSVSWYRFDASAGESISVSLNYDNRGANTLAATLYDPQGNLLAGPVAGLPLTLQAQALVTGSYYLKVEGMAGRIGYAVTLHKDAAAPLLKLSADGIPDSYYSTLADLLDRAPQAASMRLFCRSGEFNESVTVNRCDEKITISGGYDSAFSALTGKSSIKGAVRITCGKLVADGLAIR